MHERPCWDLTSVLVAVYPDRGYFTLSAPGRVQVEADAFTRFTPAKKPEDGRDRFLLADREQSARVRELLASFASQPVQAK